MADHPAKMDDSVRRRRQRVERARRHGERSVGRNLALVGVLGWLIVAPTLLGMFGGRWLDRSLGTGIVWTSALMLLGLVFGCYLAWRRVQEE
ncbi:MAG TPA: AtpZ/AtpI family protein [Myxococcales bacterium]|jgi:ATP synthase protein I